MGEATSSTAIACIEQAWLSRFNLGQVFRYELPADSFEYTGEVGMWVCRTEVIPLGLTHLSRLSTELANRGISLRVLDRLTPLKGVWQSTLHASGIRLRNAQDWGKPGWTHSKPGRQIII